MTRSVPTIDTALLVIDMQNGFLDAKGWLARLTGGVPAAIEASVAPCKRAVDAAHAAGIPVIYTQHAWQPDLRDGGFIFREKMTELFAECDPAEINALVVGSWDAALFPGFAPLASDVVVAKNRFDAFIGTDLMQVLTRRGVRHLVVGGVVTAGCVESTVRHAAMEDFRTYVVVDCVGDRDEAHGQALARMDRSYAHVVTLDDVTTAWATSRADLPNS